MGIESVQFRDTAQEWRSTPTRRPGPRVPRHA